MSPPSMCEQGCFQGIPPSSHLVVSCSPLASNDTMFWGANHPFSGKGPVPTIYVSARVLPRYSPFLPPCFVLLPLASNNTMLCSAHHLFTMFCSAHHLFKGKGPSQFTPFPPILFPLSPLAPLSVFEVPTINVGARVASKVFPLPPTLMCLAPLFLSLALCI